MSNQLCLVAASTVLDDLTGADAGWGWLDLNVSAAEGLAAVEAYSYGRHFNSLRIAGRTRDLPDGHRLRTSSTVRQAAVWYRGTPDAPLTDLHRFMRQRRVGVPVAAFKQYVNQGWVEPSADGVFYALVEDRTTDPPRWTAWDLAGGSAVPAHLVIYDKDQDLSDVYQGHWPLAEVRNATVVVIGVGSIGSAAAMGLVDYEIGELILIDPDRLKPHNVPRHRCGPEDIGRFKVDAVADLIRHTSTTNVEPLRLDVVDHADYIRPLLDDVDLVVCCADGVAARQATSHLCSMAAKSAIFACVLEDGALGEIVRDPGRSDVGCLRCLRAHLEGTGVMDPEPSLDLEYGTGTTHRPMTAIAGDLALMGQLAAKVAVSTLLERLGHRDQRLSNNHLVVGLRPALTWPAPFDTSRVLDLSSSVVPPPNPDCPLCSGDRAYA